jgi:hypothetical protein
MERGRFFRFFSQLVPVGVNNSCVDWCIDAMERGELPVCATDCYEFYLWEECFLSTSQWVRLCRLRPPACHLWSANSSIASKGYVEWVAEDTDAIAGLVQIEYLWTDLDAVENYCRRRQGIQKKIGWIVDEVDQRRRAAGLRRAWLAAVVIAQ